MANSLTKVGVAGPNADAAPPTVEELVRRAKALAPMLATSAGQAEAARMVSRTTMDAIDRAGLLRYFQPRRYGGYELDWGSQIAIGRELASGCSSTAWLVCVVGSHAAYLGRMAEHAQDDVWRDGQCPLIATGSVATGVKVRKVSDGHIVSGRWSFCSGIDHAAWALLRGTPEGDDRQHYFLIPQEELAIEDDWFVAGMRATGSKSVRVNEAHVPSYRSLPLTELMSFHPPGSRVNESTVFSYNFRPFAGTALLGPIVGTAEAALQSYINYAKDNPRSDTPTLRLDIGDPNFQLRLAESSAQIGAAGLLLDSLVERQQSYAASGQDMPKEKRIALVRDRTFAARLSFDAIDRLVTSMGLEALFSAPALHRQFRDLGAMVQQIGVNWDRNMSNCVKAMFDMETDIPYFNTP